MYRFMKSWQRVRSLLVVSFAHLFRRSLLQISSQERFDNFPGVSFAGPFLQVSFVSLFFRSLFQVSYAGLFRKRLRDKWQARPHKFLFFSKRISFAFSKRVYLPKTHLKKRKVLLFREVSSRQIDSIWKGLAILFSENKLVLKQWTYMYVYTSKKEGLASLFSEDRLVLKKNTYVYVYMSKEEGFKSLLGR